jgi:cell division initiation protein
MAEAPRQPARRRRSRHRSAVERVSAAKFPVVMRGYDRQAVDRYVADVAQIVAELEATQTREAVVQRALDEIGEQTSGILQRAHETAEEIAARSRSQAEGRIQRAEREAEAMRREVDAYSQQVVTETRRLWEDRKRLIEEMRQLADEVLAVADDALERVQEPSTEYAEDTTAEGPPSEEIPDTLEGPPAEDAAPDEGDSSPGEGNGSGDLEERAAGEDPGDRTRESKAPLDQPTAEFPGPATGRGD